MAYRNRPGAGGYTSTGGTGDYQSKIPVDSQSALRKRILAKEKADRERQQRIQAQNDKNRREQQRREAENNKASSTPAVKNAQKVHNINKTQTWNKFTDPYAINSMSDVLFNSTAKKALLGMSNTTLPGLTQPTMFNMNQTDYFTQTTKALFNYTTTQYLKPAVQHNAFNKVATNSLNALREDLDVLINPVRGLMVESGVGVDGAKWAVAGSIIAMTAVTGAAIAVAGPGAVAVLPSIGAMTSAAFAGGHIGAVGSAFVKSPANSILGMKRGLGIQGEQKQDYQITDGAGDQLDFISSSIVNMTLNPANFVANVGTLTMDRTSKSMQNLFTKNQALNPGKRPSLPDLNNAAETAMDSIYVASQAALEVDRTLMKAAFYTNPIGIGFQGVKAGGKQLNKWFKESIELSNMHNEGYDPILDIAEMNKAHNALNDGLYDDNLAVRHRQNAGKMGLEDSIVMANGEHMTYKEYFKRFGANSKQVYSMVEDKSVDYLAYSDSLPKDLDAFRKFTAQRMAVHTKGGIVGDRAASAVRAELKELLEFGVINPSWDQETTKLILDNMPNLPKGVNPDVFYSFIDEIVSGDVASSFVNKKVAEGSAILVNKVHQKLTSQSSKLDVLIAIEEEMAAALRMEKGTPMSETLTSLGYTDNNLKEHYIPMFEDIIALGKNFGIDEEDFKEFWARDTIRIEELGRSGGTNRMMSNYYAKPGSHPTVPKSSSYSLMDKVLRKTPDSIKSSALAASEAPKNSAANYILSGLKDSKILKQISVDLDAKRVPDTSLARLDELAKLLKDRQFSEEILGKQVMTSFNAPMKPKDQLMSGAAKDYVMNMPKRVIPEALDGFKKIGEIYQQMAQIYPAVMAADDLLISNREAITTATSQKALIDFMTNELMTFVKNENIALPNGLFAETKHAELIDLMKQEIQKYSSDEDFYAYQVRKVNALEMSQSKLMDTGMVLHNFQNALVGIPETVEAIVQSIDPMVQQTPEMLRLIEEMNRQAKLVYFSGGVAAHEIPNLVTKELPRFTYYAPTVDTTDATQFLVDDYIDTNKDYLKRRYIDFGFEHKQSQKLRAMDMGGTPFQHLVDADIQMEKVDRGTMLYADFGSYMVDIIESNNLSDFYHRATFDIITRYHKMEPSKFKQGLLNTTSGIHKRVINNLGMMNGTDPKNAPLIVDALLQYTDKLIDSNVPELQYVAGQGHNKTMETYRAVYQEFFEGLDEFDSVMTSELDQQMGIGSSKVLDSVAALKELQTQYAHFAMDNSVSKLRMDAAIMNSKASVGARELSSADVEREVFVPEFSKPQKRDIRHVKRIAEQIARLEGHSPNTIKHFNNDQEALEALEFYEEKLEEMMDVDIPQRLKTVDDKLLSRDAFNAISNTATTNLGLVKATTKFLRATKDLKDSDALNVGDGFDIVAENRGKMMQMLEGKSIAQELKYNTPSGVMFIEKKTMPLGFKATASMDLYKHGIVITTPENSGMWAIRYAAEGNELYDKLEKPTALFSFEGEEHMLGTHNSAAYQDLKEYDQYLRGQKNIVSIFGSDLTNWGRVNREVSVEQIRNNVGMLAAMGGSEALEAFTKGMARERGYSNQLMGTHEFMANYISSDDKSMFSHQPKDIASSIFNVGDSMVNHNNAREEMMTIIGTDTNRAANIFKKHDAQSMFENVENNPGYTFAYFNKKMQIREFKVTSPAEAQRAKDENLLFVTRSLYDSMFTNINVNRFFESDYLEESLSFYRKVLNAPFIGSAMTSFGASGRNWMDTLPKNFMASGVLPDVRRHSKLIKRYFKNNKLAKELKGDLNTPQVTDAYFLEKYPDATERQLEKAEFNLYKRKMASSAFSGYAKSVEDRIFRGVDENGEPIPEKFLENGVLRAISFKNPATLLSLTGYKFWEFISRDDLLDTLLEQGVDWNTAIATVEEFHFNYNTRTDAEMFLNTIFPFTSFPLRNLMLWQKHLFDAPSMIRAIFAAITDPYFQDDEIAEQLEDEDNDYYNYQLMSGNPIHKKNGYTTLFKLNPSLFDALTFVPKTFMDPLAKLGSPLKNMMTIYDHEKNKPAPGPGVKYESAWSKIDVPFRYQIKRFTDAFLKHGKPLEHFFKDHDGKEEEAYRRIPGLVPSLFSVNKYDPKSWEKIDRSWRPYQTRAIHEFDPETDPHKFLQRTAKLPFEKYSEAFFLHGAGQYDKEGRYKYGYKAGVTPDEWERGVRPPGYKPLDFNKLDADGRYQYGYKKGVTPDEWDRGVRPAGYKPLDFNELDDNGYYKYGYKKGVSPAEWDRGIRPDGYVPLDFNQLDGNGRYQYGYNKGMTPEEVRSKRGNYGSKYSKRPREAYGGGGGGRTYVPWTYPARAPRKTWQQKAYPRTEYANNAYARGSYAPKAYNRDAYASKAFSRGVYAPKTYSKNVWSKYPTWASKTWNINKPTPGNAWARNSYTTKDKYGNKLYPEKTAYGKKVYSRYPIWAKKVWPDRPARGRTVYGKGRRYAKHPYQKFGAPETYTAKGAGNRALSTGIVTKRGKFMASGGIGYGNASYNRNNAMGIGFGRYGAYLHNAPQGVKLRRLDYFSRSLYAKQYTKSGNSRLINRTKTLKDPKSLMYRLQDMRYNMF